MSGPRLEEEGMPLVPELTGRVALVTGGSRGIGRAIALALADCGADVAVNYVARQADGEAVADAIRGKGRRAMAVGADVSQLPDVQAMVDRVAAELGPVDVLINNAGIASKRPLGDLSVEDFDRTIAVNLRSAFLCIEAVLPPMRERGWGRIVQISSGAARGAGVVGPHYNASKAGMEGMMRGYAARLAGEGVTVNAVAPSLVQTDMTDALSQASAGRIPVGRFGRPDEVAQAVVHVIGNDYMTGQTVQVNGGLHMN
jgi:3-oxoacyl-[acyl-carrier protein] reductase